MGTFYTAGLPRMPVVLPRGLPSLEDPKDPHPAEVTEHDENKAMSLPACPESTLVNGLGTQWKKLNGHPMRQDPDS